MYNSLVSAFSASVISIYGCVILNNAYGPVANVDDPRRKTKTKITNELNVTHEGISKPPQSVVCNLNNICTSVKEFLPSMQLFIASQVSFFRS